mgnify:CR=1 FL=1
MVCSGRRIASVVDKRYWFDRDLLQVTDRGAQMTERTNVLGFRRTSRHQIHSDILGCCFQAIQRITEALPGPP